MDTESGMLRWQDKTYLLLLRQFAVSIGGAKEGKNEIAEQKTIPTDLTISSYEMIDKMLELA